MGKYKYCKVQLIHETWDMTICNRHTDEEDISIENLVPGFDLARAAGNEKMRIKVVNIDDKQMTIDYYGDIISIPIDGMPYKLQEIALPNPYLSSDGLYCIIRFQEFKGSPLDYYCSLDEQSQAEHTIKMISQHQNVYYLAKFGEYGIYPSPVNANEKVLTVWCEELHAYKFKRYQAWYIANTTPEKMIEYVKEKLGADGKIAIGPVEDLNCNHTYLTIDEFLKITKPEEEK